jgi:hypothetical protein
MSATQLSLSPPPARSAALPAALGLAGAAWFAFAVVALHFLRPDLDPLSRATSEYAIGPYGYLMASAFFSLSLASWALLLALGRRLAGPARSRAGLALLGVWAACVLAAMIFPIDAAGAPSTTAGLIHNASGPIGFLSLALGALFISRRFRHDAALRPIARPAVGLSLLLLAAFFAVPAAMASGLPLAGLAQRLLLAACVAWLSLTATCLRAAASQAATASAPAARAAARVDDAHV